jgi:hypothetical protein
MQADGKSFVISHAADKRFGKWAGTWKMEFRIVDDNTLTIWFGRVSRVLDFLHADHFRFMQIAKFERCMSIAYETDTDSQEKILAVRCNIGVQYDPKTKKYVDTHNAADVSRYYVPNVLNDIREDNPWSDWRYHFSEDEIDAALAWANAKLKQRPPSQNAAMRNVYFVDTPHQDELDNGYKDLERNLQDAGW